MIITKDVTELVAPFILMHVVNDSNVMGAGVAKAISDKWPEVKSDYHNYFKVNRTPVLGEVILSRVGERMIVLSLLAQVGYGRDGKNRLDYAALTTCLESAQRISTNLDIPLYAPFQMGAGLAGGDWDTVKSLLDKHSTIICKR
jgi:O-acetyl-ADP-ribose deacetylase (regulator of RNase III)